MDMDMGKVEKGREVGIRVVKRHRASEGHDNI